MAAPASLGSIAVSTVGEAVAFAAGFAAARALEPLGNELAQTAWDADPSKAVDAGTAAGIVAESVELHEWGASEARKHGISEARFDAILGETLNAPGMGELLQMLRRDSLTAADFAHGLRKAKLETRWDDALRDLGNVKLDPAVIAAGIVRGLVHDPGILPVGPPTTVGRIPAFPVFNIDALAEAAASGLDKERLSVLVGNYGRPMSPDQAARATFRAIIERVDFDRAISEGDIRNEWADAIFEEARQILTPHEYQEAALRGIITNGEADAGAAKRGMSADDAHLLFQIMGRPLPVHQITTGLERGGEYGGSYTDVPEPYQDAIRRSNIRPEYARLAYANRYNLPSAFVLRSLAQTGELAPADVHKTLLQLGWEPSFAEKVTAAWTGGKTTKGDPHVTKAESQLWTALHKAFVNDEATDALAHTTLTEIGVTPDGQTEVVKLWTAERALVRATLTATQIKKAVGQPGKDKAWALERLHELGYTAADAETLLAE